MHIHTFAENLNNEPHTLTLNDNELSIIRRALTLRAIAPDYRGNGVRNESVALLDIIYNYRAEYYNHERTDSPPIYGD